MERPTTEFILPNSKVKVVFYSYITIGQDRALKKLAYQTLKLQFTPGDPNPEIDKMDAGIQIDSQVMALGFLLKEVFDAEGNKVENPNEYLNNLRSIDADILFEKIDEITASSAMSDDAKKNSVKLL